MDRPVDRRGFLLGVSAAPVLPCLASLGWLPGGAAPGGDATPAPVRAAPPHFPHQDPALVREVVGASHRDLDRVTELVTARPALARASWDWGFGDWESALGAASHVGRPDIAEFLIANGARPNLFTLAMLGRLDAVRAAVTSSPGIEAIHGPHGITLLAHARAGGDAAAPVLAYLEELGTADPRPALVALTLAETAAFVGAYAFGPETGDRIEIVERQGYLELVATDAGGRRLLHLGGGEFHPVGVPSVRVRFASLEVGRAPSLTLIDADVTLVATRGAARARPRPLTPRSGP